MRSDHSCGLCASCILFGKLSHITEVPAESRWVVDLPPQKKCAVWWYYSIYIIWGYNRTYVYFLGMTKKILQPLLLFFRPPFVVWAHPAPLQASLERFLGDSALVLFDFWAVEHGSWGGGVCVFLFFSGAKKEQAFREFSSPPLVGWMSIPVFFCIWMIKSWKNDALLTDLMLDKAIF